MVHARNMNPVELGNQMYFLALGHLVMNVVVTLSLIALAPWLAGQQRSSISVCGDVR
jgi:hypothetical protein